MTSLTPWTGCRGSVSSLEPGSPHVCATARPVSWDNNERALRFYLANTYLSARPFQSLCELMQVASYFLAHQKPGGMSTQENKEPELEQITHRPLARYGTPEIACIPAGALSPGERAGVDVLD